MTPDPIATSNIASRAFALMELAPISSYGDDSDQARAARDHYPHALQEMLEHYDWSFARRVYRLALTTLPNGEFTDPNLPYAFRLPPQTLALRHVENGHKFRWRVDGDLLRSEEETPPIVRLTVMPSREADLPALFRAAVAHQLAVTMSAKYVTTRTKRVDLKQDLADAVAAAKEHDARTASHHRMDGRPEQPDWSCEAQQ